MSLKRRAYVGIAAAAFLSACLDITAPPPPVVAPAVIHRAAIDTLATGAVVLDLLASDAVRVEVRYWNETGNILEVRDAVPAAGQGILLPELEAGHHYTYLVSAYNSRNVPCEPARGEFDVPGLPADLAMVRFVTRGTSTMPLTMVQSFMDFMGFVIVDRTGAPVWWWRAKGSPQGFARRANGNFVLLDATKGLYEVTPARKLVHAMTDRAVGVVHHDVLVTPENTVLFLTSDTRTVADSTLTGDAIWEWTPETGAVRKRWSVFDALDPATDVGPKSNAADWTHANSISFGDHGNVILSLNWLDQVLSLSPDFSRIEWRLGGHGSTYTFAPDASFHGQHTAEILPNGHVMMFDNGRDRAAPNRYSRALELALDAGTHTASVAWSYRATPEAYSPYMGSARRLANGNTFVFFPLPQNVYGASGTSGGFEVRPDGSVAFELRVENSGVPAPIYRGEPLASLIAPDRSALVRVSP